jgi:transposase
MELAPMSDTVITPMPEPVRRIEVFTGAGRRRAWSTEEKGRIIAESYGEGETVSGVARRYGLNSSQLFWWRRAARQAMARGGSLGFAPVVVKGEGKANRRAVGEAARSSQAMIEIVLGAAVVRVGEGADAGTLSVVLTAIKAVAV